MKKTLLIFSHYGRRNFSTDALRYFLELRPYFSDAIIGSNLKLDSSNLPAHVIHCENKGYDFGIYFQAMRNINHFEFDRIALVNDSNSLVGNFENVFEWGKKTDYDFWGITDSCEITHGTQHLHNPYHIQSHFMILEKKALPHFRNFFINLDFENEYMIDSRKTGLREKIIDHCEIGFSDYLRSHHLRMGAKWSIFSTKYPYALKRHISEYNIHFWDWESLIRDGYPLIKNKILNGIWLSPQGNHQPYAVPNGTRGLSYYQRFIKDYKLPNRILL